MNNQRGVALLYLIILFTLLGVLVSTGVRKFGATVNLGKTKDTKAELERDVQMITAWAVKNSKLPSTLADVFGTSPPLDAWSQPIHYFRDLNLVATASGGLCGRTATTGQEVAFMLISGGDDVTVNSTITDIPNGMPNGPASAEDLYRSVSLMELRALAGCDGPTQGSLKILNNELPKACAGSASYPATLYASGGVPTAYTWTLPTPWNLQIISTTGILSPSTRITITPGLYSVNAKLSDTFSEVQRTYTVAVTILGSCSAACFADPTCRANFVATPACFNACFADIGCSKACFDNAYCVTECGAVGGCSTAYSNRAQ
jgi:hypothetical protein